MSSTLVPIPSTPTAAAPGSAMGGGASRVRRWVTMLMSWAAAGAMGALLWRGVSPFLGGGVAMTLAVAAHWLCFGWRRWWQRGLGGCALVLALAPAALGVHQVVCWYGPRPQPVRTPLFQGVEYIRQVITRPHTAVIHILRVDLRAPGVSVIVTPPDFPADVLALKARTTSDFVRQFKVQAAINAGAYFPFEKSIKPWVYYPMSGDPVGVLGGGACQGVQYGTPSRLHPILHIARDGHASIEDRKPRPWYTAVTGIKHFIVDGKPIYMSAGAPGACTVAATDRTGTILLLVVVDGEQPPYSEGIDRMTLTRILLDHGAFNAIAFDGGGSSTMAIQDAGGRPQRLNRPVQLNIPGFERPVGNHIGILAQPLARP